MLKYIYSNRRVTHVSPPQFTLNHPLQMSFSARKSHGVR